jgi:hypothetical protein
MIDSSSHEILNKLYRILNVVPTNYVNALLALHQRFEGKNVEWIINGDLSEALKTVNVTPEAIEIVCTKQDTDKMFQQVQDLSPSPLNMQTRQLARNALIDGKEYPVYTRSLYFDFSVNNVLVKVQGDLQFKVGDWDWGDIYLFAPEYVYVVGKKTAVTPLLVKAELYQYLGWSDRFEELKRVIQKPLAAKQKRP